MPNFSQPGQDGAIPPQTTEWQRGLVYTAKSEILSPLLPGHEYRITASFKQSITEGEEFTAYENLYRRVARMVNTRIAELTHSGDEFLRTWIVCQGWGTVGESYHIATAFLTMGLICPKTGDVKPHGENEPTPALLMAPRGTTVEELARIDWQRVNEIYNEFDFTDPSSASADPIMLSYGERVSTCEGIDFEPFVKRAEKFAKAYYEFLECEPKLQNNPFQILRREWYSVTSPDLAVVHIHFRAQAGSSIHLMRLDPVVIHVRHPNHPAHLK